MKERESDLQEREERRKRLFFTLIFFSLNGWPHEEEKEEGGAFFFPLDLFSRTRYSREAGKRLNTAKDTLEIKQKDLI